MAELSPSTQKLIQRYQAWYQFLQPKKEIPTLHVDEVATKVASLYEKVRGVIDWREEHLLKRAAIERILKRRLLARKNGELIAEPLILELIRGGHFPNDKIEVAKIEDVQKLIDKYIFILENAPTLPKKPKLGLYDWLSSIAACEVEEVLQPPLREETLMDYMYELMKERIRLREGVLVIGGMSEEEKNTQIYISVRRALFKLDPPIISYHLLKRRYPDWSHLSEIKLKSIAETIYSIQEEIQKEMSHPSAQRFYKVCERYDTAYLILGDIISEDPLKAKQNLENPEILETKIKQNYDKRLQKVKARVKRMAIYATLSIFFTKMLLAFAIEVPFDKYVTHEFSHFTLGLNILIPPLLMFFLILTVRPPKKENLNRVIMDISKIVLRTEKKEVYEIQPFKKRGAILNAIIILFYLFTLGISFGIIFLGLGKLQFSILSKIIFLMFVSLISFAGLKIKERAKELQMIEEKPGFLTFIIDTFSLPFLRVGRWLSTQWARHNILIVVFSSLIDMPFQIFVEFLEHWRAFLKEKKEEIH